MRYHERDGFELKVGKFFTKILVLTGMLLIMTGCADGGAPPAEDDPPEQEHVFIYNGTTIKPGTDAGPVSESLGEPLRYFEAPSCAFEGLDKIYYYSGFELYTYPADGKDFISSIVLTDDSTATDKDIRLGMTLDDMLAAYGESDSRDGDQYTYTLGKTSLSFIIEDGVVASITYGFDNL